jgi:terminase small subunit / prophage DNA-packing protein
MQTHSLSEAATLLGLHRNTLAEWLCEGCPSVEKADRTRGIEWKLALPEIMRWRIERAVADAVAPYSGGGDMITREEADRRRAVAVARVAEIELDEKLRSVLHVADAKEITAEFAQAVKRGGDNAFNKIAARACQLKDPNEIRALCEAEWNRGMSTAREELRRLWDLKMAGLANDLAEPDDELP